MNRTKLREYIEYLKEQPDGFVFSHKIDKRELLSTLFDSYKKCISCPLAQQGRIQVVFGDGNPEAELMLIGEGPGRNEDIEGKPFVGRAGKLLTQIIEALGYKRKDIWISNIVKCRPPKNRTPMPEEREKCASIILDNEIKIIQPKIICALGSTAAQFLLGPTTKISKARGTINSYKNTPVMTTYHPAYLLRNPSEKSTVWKDMLKIKEFLAK